MVLNDAVRSARAEAESLKQLSQQLVAAVAGFRLAGA